MDQPDDVDDEPTRVDAERPLDRVEAARAETPRCWGRERPQQGAEGGQATTRMGRRVSVKVPGGELLFGN